MPAFRGAVARSHHFCAGQPVVVLHRGVDQVELAVERLLAAGGWMRGAGERGR